jgi:quercetin dioxygenase-like cupin family protein
MNTTAIQDAVSVSVSASGEGEARWWWGNLAVLRLTGEDTNGGLTVVELTMGAERMTPRHVHHREEETFHVLEGALTFHIGDSVVQAGPGDIVVGPRDVPHRFVAGPDGARLLFLLTPSGLEGLIREQSIPATTRTLPPPGTPPPNIEHAREVALRYGCELLV